MKQVFYVAGFLFTDDSRHVVLIEKVRPEWQAGLLNGIGGHVEPGETPLEAMVREFNEETGVEVSTWKQFATLKGESDVQWTVHFFCAFDTRAFQRVEQMTDESPVKMWVDSLDFDGTIPNLSWLIPMALTMKRENASRFEIQEAYASAAV